MNLTQPVITLICKQFKGETVFIGDDIRGKTESGFINAIETELILTTSIKKAFLLIENNVGDYATPIVMTDSAQNTAPNCYEYRFINKANNVAMFIKRICSTYSNPYVEQNLYRLNYNQDLFRLRIKKLAHRDSVKVSRLYGQYESKRLIIVGGGESWQKIKWDRLASDILVMIVNYNFTIKADFLIYNDKKVGRDLETVTFLDDRKIIGFKDHKSRVTHYVYDIPGDGVSVSHTGAMAVQIAEKMGFEKVYLAGFDYKKGKNGKDQVYKKLKNDYYKDSRIKRFVDDFEKFNTEKTYNINNESNLRKLPFAETGELYIDIR